MSAEEWRPVIGREGWLEVSSLGRIRSWLYPTRFGPKRRKTPRILRACPRSKTSPYLVVSVPTIAVHRAVLEAFVGPCPVGMEAAHNNGVATDNRLENLRWSTHADNLADRVRHGTAPWLKTTSVECGCGRRYTPADFLKLEQVGVQKEGGFTGGDLLLANCRACHSTISMEAEP